MQALANLSARMEKIVSSCGRMGPGVGYLGSMGPLNPTLCVRPCCNVVRPEHG